MKLLSSKKKFLVLVRQPDNNWAHAWVTLRPGGLVPKYVRVGGDRYRFEPEHSWLLKGGDPTRHDGFWSAFIDFVDKRDKFLLFYRGPGEAPVDLTPTVQTEMAINPRLGRILTKSKLYDDYLKRLRYDKGISPVMVMLMFIGIAALFVFMYLGGYFR